MMGEKRWGEWFVRRGEFVRKWIKAGGETPPLRSGEWISCADGSLR